MASEKMNSKNIFSEFLIYRVLTCADIYEKDVNRMSDLSGRSFVGVQMLLSPCHVYYRHIYRVLNLFMDPFSRPYDFTLLHF